MLKFQSGNPSSDFMRRHWLRQSNLCLRELIANEASCCTSASAGMPFKLVEKNPALMYLYLGLRSNRKYLTATAQKFEKILEESRKIIDSH